MLAIVNMYVVVLMIYFNVFVYVCLCVCVCVLHSFCDSFALLKFITNRRSCKNRNRICLALAMYPPMFPFTRHRAALVVLPPLYDNCSCKYCISCRINKVEFQLICSSDGKRHIHTHIIAMLPLLTAS